ncbi:nitrate ABC transporter ATP-binding protein [Candidatus Kuenenbacteria bacterium CG11_big_fil_rev_8_21_14_0_20_37_9]|nr:MAG: nitrate ABC transporter ATP-binding protein [Candidatus Kuenenbacteria bacterium CG11_big_fil_rev_8_21_14_0_20_37_9]
MLKITNLSKSYQHNGSPVKVFELLNLEILRGEFVGIFGPNGCGKTTLLNLISGLDKNFSGEINFDNKVKISYIFQNYRESIFPWLTIAENIAYPLKLRGHTREEQREAARKICNQFDIKFDLSDYPHTLSGGQQQLAAILRGLITKPDILLFDEPLSSLDYQTTLFMLNKIQEIWQETKTTILFISHNIDEAVTLSQKIILLSNKPTKIVKIFDNHLNYPRKTDILGSSEFVELKHNILSEFTHEIKV